MCGYTNFFTENREGPKWKYVVRRVTVDIDTPRVIEDWRNPHDIPIKELYRLLPDGVKNIKIILYYKDEAPKSNVWSDDRRDDAQLSCNHMSRCGAILAQATIASNLYSSEKFL